MAEIGEVLARWLDFAASYGLVKCIKTMLAGSVAAILLLAWQKTQKEKNSYLHIGSLLLLFPMCLMGSNKLFFYGRIFCFSNWLQGAIKPWHGKLYFAVAGAFLLWHCVQAWRLRTSIKTLPAFSDTRLLGELIEEITQKDRFPVFRWYLKKVHVYETKEALSPFSAGLLRPYVVLPAQMAESFRQEEIRLVLVHELLHIKAGHIWLLAAFSFLRMYWWLNPFVYVCEKRLREGLELACDESCLYHLNAPKEQYAGVLLHMLRLVRGMPSEGLLAFLGRDSFGELKRRLEGLQKAGEEGGCHQKRVRKGVCISGALLGVAMFLVLASSYPKYTTLEEISLYDSHLELVLLNSEKMHQAVQCKKGKIQMDEQLFGEILEEENIEGEYVFVAYGMIMKVPGVGGGGNVAMVFTEDLGDICYLAADGFVGWLQTFLLKYVV